VKTGTVHPVNQKKKADHLETGEAGVKKMGTARIQDREGERKPPEGKGGGINPFYSSRAKKNE